MNHNVNSKNSNLTKDAHQTKKCTYCVQNQLDCDSAVVPCSNCTSIGKTDNCTNKDNFTTTMAQPPAPALIPAKGQKRGYKSHVPSACINCKIAHLACDVSRPCKRCIALKKTDTCQDMQHKKRGRPKLKDKKAAFPSSMSSANEDNFRVLYGTIETPALIFNNSTNAASSPASATTTTVSVASNNNNASSLQQQNTISFIHEPIESFRTTATSTASYTNTNDDTHTPNHIPMPISIAPSLLSHPTATTTVNSSNNDMLLTPIPMKPTPANLTSLQQANFTTSPSNPASSTTATGTTTFVSEPMAMTASEFLPQPFFWDANDSSGHDENNIISSLLPFMTLDETLTNTSPTAATVTYNSGTNTLPSQMPGAFCQNEALSHDDSITLILSMEVCCAKAPDDIIKHWGYYPQELAHRSFYDFISPKDTDRLARLHRLLIDNTMTIIKNQQLSAPMSLPGSERSTSTLFSTADLDQLVQVANGSKQYSDTIHIKKRDGEFELYDVIVYSGGGLGADLYDFSSLSKQYIVAQLKKHEYEVKPAITTAAAVIPSTPIATEKQQQTPGNFSTATTTQNNINGTVNSSNKSSNNISSDAQSHPIAAFSPLSPLSPASPSSASTASSNNAAYSSRYSNNNYSDINSRKSHQHKPFLSIKPSATASSPLNLFNKIDPSNNHLASFEKKKRQLSISAHRLNFISTTSSTPTSLHQSPPKFHIAPIHSPIKKSMTTVLPTMTTPSSTTQPTTAVVVNPSTASGITHPTQQYFLQTSSSTLNAAASAVQNKSRTTSENPIMSTTTGSASRKIEMSIRSLLC